MTWTVYGKTWEAGELTGTAMSQAVILPNNTILKGIRTWIIGYNDPDFDTLNCKIYGNDASDDSPSKLLFTSSDSRTKAEIQITDVNWHKEIYFTFSDVVLKGGDTYHFAINSPTYNYSSSSFLSWRIAWPDPVYIENWTPTLVNSNRAPFFISSFVGANF